jgi:hypothetical protein
VRSHRSPTISPQTAQRSPSALGLGALDDGDEAAAGLVAGWGWARETGRNSASVTRQYPVFQLEATWLDASSAAMVVIDGGGTTERKTSCVAY